MMSKCRILHHESQLNSFKPHKSELKLHADKGCEILATVQFSLVTFLPANKKCKDTPEHTPTAQAHEVNICT